MEIRFDLKEYIKCLFYGHTLSDVKVDKSNIRSKKHYRFCIHCGKTWRLD